MTAAAQRGSGGIGYNPVGSLASWTISSAPNGGWTGIPDPKVFVASGKAFLGWVDSTSGENEFAEYDLTAQTLSTPVALGTGLADDGPPDNHNSGSILARSSDGRLVAAYAGHFDTTPRVRISTNPYDATAWGSEYATFSGSGFATTYCTLVELTSEGKLYLFWRDEPGGGTNTGRLAYSTSTDNGATWSAMTVLFTGGTGEIPYWRIGTNGTDRIDVFTTDDHPGSSSSLYHFYITGGARYKSDGTLISTSLPLTVSDFTLVKNASEGSVFPFGACWDGAAPACAFQVNLSGTDSSTRTARWRSGAWQLNTVASAGGTISGNVFAPGASIHKTNPNVLWMARLVGSFFEMYRYTTADDGATWTGTQVTSGSAAHNAWPDTATHGGFALEAVWLYGTYTDDTNFSFGVRGAGYR